MGKKLLKSAALHILALICVAATLLPLVFMVSTSFKVPAEIFTKEPVIIPEAPTMDNYLELFRRIDFGRCFANSLIVALGLTLFSLFVNSLAAYAFAKLAFPGREKLFALLLVTMMVPGQVTMMPVFIILKHLGLLNSYLGLIIPGGAGVFAIFMLRQFMVDVPEALLESARIDGCGELRIYWSIMLPLCRPVLATLLIFNFMGAWNEFLWPLIVMLSESKYTLPVALANLNGQYNAEWGLLMAGSVIVILPVVLVFLMAQKHYIKGIAAGAVKG
ncbi:MAG: carbohydrate ABC transporter permease [Candidatus Wallbacteria bacterium]|nr:carbohydrate ABC transporter permease [Candidatus Wallbacteria bacterium]